MISGVARLRWQPLLALWVELATICWRIGAAGAAVQRVCASPWLWPQTQQRQGFWEPQALNNPHHRLWYHSYVHIEKLLYVYTLHKSTFVNYWFCNCKRVNSSKLKILFNLTQNTKKYKFSRFCWWIVVHI